MCKEITWRLIHSSSNTGAMNMAIDEAILEFTGKNLAPSTLRFYSWDPPCLSLGYSQSIKDINSEKLSRFGWDIVRRPTGGKAILHTDELTYAVISNAENPMVVGSVLDAYSRIARCLVSGLKLLGVNATSDAVYLGSENSPAMTAVCFERPSNYEIAVDGKKLIGSAQSRRLGAVLQHGSLPLFGSLTRILEVLSFSDPKETSEASSRLLKHATSLENVNNLRITFEEARNALIQGFIIEWGIKFIEENLSQQENERALELCEKKFALKEWTSRL